jgi:hypothetical protein
VRPGRMLEMRAMAAHEAWISRPVKELFAGSLAGERKAVCRHCGKTFTISFKVAKPKVYCTSACKTTFIRERKKARAA